MANGHEGDPSSWLHIIIEGATLVFGIFTGAIGAAWRMADRLRKWDVEIANLLRELEQRQSTKLEEMHKDNVERQDLLHRENIKRHDALRDQLREFDRAIGQIEGRQESAERRRRERSEE